MRAIGAERPCRPVGDYVEPTIVINDTLSTVYQSLSELDGYGEWVRILAARVEAQQRSANSGRNRDRSVQPI